MKLASKLTSENLPEATAMVEQVMKIRGYGPVKEQAIAKIKPAK